MKNKSLAVVIVCIFLSIGCSLGCSPKINDAEKLALALKNQGLNYQELSCLKEKPRYIKIDQAIELKGENLHLKIFKITNKKNYKQFFAAVVLVGGIKKRIGDVVKISAAYSKPPFIILVIEEPRSGQTKAALNKIFPARGSQG